MKNHEFDQLVIDKLSSVFLHLEVKSIIREKEVHKDYDQGLRREYDRSCEQIKIGKDMFHNIIAPNCKLSANWAYQVQLMR